MQRLLADAEKISGIHYDISSLNDVYNAIHVVQQEMGITGTTAKEAATTISGSAAAMKAAWQNMLVGIADGNADFSGLISNLVDSVNTFAGNLLPVVQQALNGIGNLIQQLAPVIAAALPGLLESVLPGLLDAALSIVTALAEALPDMLVTVITTLTTFFADNAGTILETGINLLMSLYQGIASALPELIPLAVETLLTLVDTYISNIDLVVDTGIQIITGLIDGIINALPKLIEKAPEIIIKLVEAIVNNYPKILEAGVKLIGELVKGLIQAIPNLVKAVPQLVTAFVNGFNNLKSQITSIGKNIVDGVWQGIKNAASTFTANVKSFFKNIVDSVKSALGIKSPSRVFRDEVGKMMAAGIGVGFSDEMENVRRDVLNEVDGLSGNVGTISAGFEASVSAAPVATTDAGINGVAQRIIDAINNRETSVRVFLDSKEIRAGQERLARAMG